MSREPSQGLATFSTICGKNAGSGLELLNLVEDCESKHDEAAPEVIGSGLFSAASLPLKVPSVLCSRTDSVYHQLGCDVWDAQRDAANYAGSNPIVAHPPCAGWGRLRKQSTIGMSQRWLAWLCLHHVQVNGGVLEHPASSSFWAAADLPRPGQGYDATGGFTIALPQWWFGHPAAKATWLYICGCSKSELPVVPLRLGVPSYAIGSRSLPCVSKPDREHTPIDFAKWLVRCSQICHVPSRSSAARAACQYEHISATKFIEFEGHFLPFGSALISEKIRKSSEFREKFALFCQQIANLSENSFSKSKKREGKAKFRVADANRAFERQNSSIFRPETEICAILEQIEFSIQNACGKSKIELYRNSCEHLSGNENFDKNALTNHCRLNTESESQKSDVKRGAC
jgi:hypothetical protein